MVGGMGRVVAGWRGWAGERAGRVKMGSRCRSFGGSYGECLVGPS